ncbi:MAG: hypothetical protein KDA25_12765 [Phycisphaerales bacterium]|nr:hypothetical protein [Phycisphaerales bacterium]
MLPPVGVPSPCVVLTRRVGDDRLASVRALAAERGWRLIEAAHPVTAMAQLCLLDRARASRRAADLEHPERVGLLIDGPTASREIEMLLEAAHRYGLATDLWVRGADGEVRVLTCPTRTEAPPVRAARDRRREIDPSTVTTEELDMLLHAPSRTNSA